MPMNARLLRPRSAGGFDPRVISGLALWLDGSDTSTLGNTSTGPGGATNNGPVKYWGDKSGNGRHATNSGADSVCPTLLVASENGRPSLSFDGGDWLLGSWNVTLTSQTTIVVAKVFSTTGNPRVFNQSDAASDFSTTGHYIPINSSSSANSVLWSWADGGFRAGAGGAVSQLHILSSTHTGSEIQNRLNGGAATTYSHTLNKTFTRYALAVALVPNPGVSFLNGRICEVLSYSRNLSDAERASVLLYLSSRWGVAI